MTWLYVQVWLWYLAAFGSGLGLAWLVLARPQQHRLARLGALAPPTPRPDGDPAGPGAAGPGRSGPDLFGADLFGPASSGPARSRPDDRAGDAAAAHPHDAEAATGPAVDSALSLLDSRLDFGRHGAGADAATRDLATDPASPPPAGNPPPGT